MFVTFIAAVALMLGSASMGFKSGQDNPDANSILDSNATVFVDDRTYGVDE